MEAGTPKNKQMSEVTTNKIYLSQISSQPIHSSLRGHKLPFSAGKHSSASMAMLEAIIKTRIIRSVDMKTKKELWLLTPTQLLIHGQWWSNLSTQRLQIAQCLLLGVLSTSHSGHISQGWTFDRISMNWYSGLIKPGSLAPAIVKEMASTIESNAIE